jgi:hypothetical protein
MDVWRRSHAQVVVALGAGLIAGAVAAANVYRKREANLAQECQERAYDAAAVPRMREAYHQWKHDPSVGRPYSQIRPTLVAAGRLEERSREPAL